MPIHLCAEHLIHIQTLSIQAVLSTVSNKETRATLSADGTTLTLSHEGEEASVVLPINISPNKRSNASMILPAAPSKEVSLRVQLEQRPGIDTGPLSALAAENDSTVPWTAADLTSESEISCRSCDAVIVPRGRIRDWKDLPSEGWAEMMDYWHCHRPTDHDTHDHSGLKKGYAADSQLTATAGVALIAAVDFILNPEDCDNIQTTPSPDLPISCTNCTSILGHQDPSTNGYKLSKLHLSISLSPSLGSISYHPSKWLSCLFLNATESQGVRKFLLRPPSIPNSNSSLSKLRIWLFTPDLIISSSAYPPEPVRVAKVLWQDLSQATDDDEEDEVSERLNAQSLSEGEILLPEEELVILKEELEKSSAWLPENARNFGDGEWKVGLLLRFTEEELGRRR